MARIHGRRGVVYAELISGSAPTNVTFLKSWSINFSVSRIDVTAFGDPNVVYLQGLPDASGDFAGFYDDATDQFYTAARNGFASSLYIYPDSATTSRYFYGEALIDASYSAAVDGAVELSASWAAAGPFQRQG